MAKRQGLPTGAVSCRRPKPPIEIAPSRRWARGGPSSLPCELISLTVVDSGKPQQIELSIFVHLKLRESSRHLIKIDYRPKLPSRTGASDENVAVPRHKLKLCAACQQLHDQCIALRRDLGLAEAWIEELAGERCEPRKRSWISRLGKQLDRRLKIGFSIFKILRNGIVVRVAKNPIQYPPS